MSKTLESTIVRVKLDSDTYQAYEQQASRQAKMVEDLIAQRLHEVQTQDSYDGRTVVINPNDRQRLEAAIQRKVTETTRVRLCRERNVGSSVNPRKRTQAITRAAMPIWVHS